MSFKLEVVNFDTVLDVEDLFGVVLLALVGETVLHSLDHDVQDVEGIDRCCHSGCTLDFANFALIMRRSSYDGERHCHLRSID